MIITLEENLLVVLPSIQPETNWDEKTENGLDNDGETWLHVKDSNLEFYHRKNMHITEFFERYSPIQEGEKIEGKLVSKLELLRAEKMVNKRNIHDFISLIGENDFSKWVILVWLK